MVDWQVELLKLGMTSEQMQQIERDRQNVHQIFLNHGVPLSIAGIDKTANYATSRQDYINFKNIPATHWLWLFRKLNKALVKYYNDDYKIDFVVNGLVDGEAVVREFLPLLSQGAITPNELRDLAGLPKVDNPLLDSFYINTQLIPMEMVGLANSFGDVPNEIIENQVETAGGDPNRVGQDVSQESNSSIDNDLLRLRNPRESLMRVVESYTRKATKDGFLQIFLRSEPSVYRNSKKIAPNQKGKE